MKKRNALASLTLAGALVAGISSAGFAAQNPHASHLQLTGKAHGVTLTLMFGSSGPAETAAVNAAAKAWAAKSRVITR